MGGSDYGSRHRLDLVLLSYRVDPFNASCSFVIAICPADRYYYR